MQWREWLNNNPIASIGAGTVLLVIALGILALQMGGGHDPATVYFWDLETNEPFAATTVDRPPITAPSGGEGVRAYLFTCGACAADEWIGHLETHRSPGGAGPEGGHDEELFVRALGGEQWVAFDSPAADDILAAPYEQCAQPRECLP